MFKVTLLFLFFTFSNSNLFSQINNTCKLSYNPVLVGCSRIGKYSFDPANKEQTTCKLNDITQIKLKNNSKQDWIIQSISLKNGVSGFSLKNQLTFPIIVKPNVEIVLNVHCVSPIANGFLEDTIVVSSNARANTSFSIGIDESNSMNNDMACLSGNKNRIGFIQNAFSNFITNKVLSLAGNKVIDELYMLTYSTQYLEDTAKKIPRDIRNIFAHQKMLSPKQFQDAIKSLQTISPSRDERVGGWAIRELAQGLKKTTLNNKIAIVYVSGDPDKKEISAGVDIVAKTAKENNCRVFIIAENLSGIGMSYYNYIAKYSNGHLFNTKYCDELQCILDSVAYMSDIGGDMEIPLSIKVASPELSASSFQLDTTQPNISVCKNVTLSNRENAGDITVNEIFVTDLYGKVSDVFNTQKTAVPFVVRQGASSQVTICFTPKQLGIYEGYVNYRNNVCDNSVFRVKITGYCYDDVSGYLPDTLVIKRGTEFLIKLNTENFSSRYNVSNLKFNVEYDKNLLNLDTVFAGFDTKGIKFKIIKTIFLENKAVSTIEGSNPNFINSGEVVKLKFSTIYGMPKSNKIAINQSGFENGLLKLNVVNQTVVKVDEDCFGSQTMVEPKVENIYKVGLNANPLHGDILIINFWLQKKTQLTVTIQNSNVSYTDIISTKEFQAGQNQIEFNTKGLAKGVYFITMYEASNSQKIVKLFFSD